MPDSTSRPARAFFRRPWLIAGGLLAATLLGLLVLFGQPHIGGDPATRGPEQLAPYTPSANTENVTPYVARPHSGSVTVLPRAQPRVAAASVDASAPASEEGNTEGPIDDSVPSSEGAAPVADTAQP